jgi:hypothetical protein
LCVFGVGFLLFFDGATLLLVLIVVLGEVVLRTRGPTSVDW